MLEARPDNQKQPAARTTAVSRLLSVDFWRGFAIITIFINHIPGNLFEAYTHKNFGFSDAAELFVLLAGMAAAFAYLPGLASDAARTVMRIGLRAWTLYMAHLTLIAVCGAIVAYAVLVTEDTRLLEATQFDQIMSNPLSATLGVATLGLQPAYLNILPLYIVLLLLAPAMMSLVRVSPWLALAVSGAIYTCAQLLQLTLPAYPTAEAWYFNPFAWQFLFVTGLCIGGVLGAGRRVMVGNLLLVASVAYVLLALVWWRMGWIIDLSPVPRFLWDFDKTNLSIPRLLHVLALACIVSRLPIESWLRRTGLGRPLILLGRHSLPVFCVGTALGMAATPVRVSELGHPALDLMIIPGGIVVQLALAWVLEWYRGSPSTTSSRATRAASSADMAQA